MTESRYQNKNKKDLKNTKRLKHDPLYWEELAQRHHTGTSINLTAGFFEKLPPGYKSHFESSTKTILQFGVCSGAFLAKSGLSTKRKCIGYDLANKAIKLANKNHIQARLLDLNSLDKFNRLAYQETLENDLSTPIDLLAINVIEYLDDEVIITLLFYLIATAKPGSTFYFQTYISNSPDEDPHLPHGYLASFFAPQINFKYQYHAIKEINNIQEIVGTADLLVVSKLY